MFTHIFGGISALEPIVCVLDPIMRGFAMDSSAFLLEVQVNAYSLLHA